MKKFYGWYYATTMVSIIFGFTVLVDIQEKMGWKIGYGVSAVLMLFATPCFLVASSYYVKTEVKSNLFTELIQVVVASYKKRTIKTKSTSDDDDDIVYYHGSNSSNDSDSKLLFPSEKFR